MQLFYYIKQIMSYGSNSYGRITTLWNESGAKLTVGKFCSIAGNVIAYLGGNHRTDWVTTYPFGTVNKAVFNTFNVDHHGHPATKGDVVIGNDVWIATNVTIMSGVTIGDGAVIACNSHVVKDVPPYTIVGGNPARPIRQRFTDEQVAKLLEIKWWDWENAKINRFAPLLCNPDIDLFIREAEAEASRSS
jgi:acetyltransferase-like isoleucine patch superfamily enzyme